MSLEIPGFFSANQIPNFDNPITSSTGKVLQGIWIFCHRIHSVNMSLAKLCNEWRSKHALHLRRIESFGIFSSALEGVESRIQIAGLSLDMRPRRLGRRRGSGESLDFLKHRIISPKFLSLQHQIAHHLGSQLLVAIFLIPREILAVVKKLREAEQILTGVCFSAKLVAAASKASA